MGPLIEDKVRYVELSFFAPLIARFGGDVPEITKRLIATKFGNQDVESLVSAAIGLLRGADMPTLADCVRACQSEVEFAEKRNCARTPAEMWAASSSPHKVHRIDPDWLHWYAICKANGISHALHRMDAQDSWSMPCRHPRDFIAICVAAGVNIIDPWASALSMPHAPVTFARDTQLAASG